jgi:two-component system, NarL family, nitrate/nitrite response regulator NarL
MASIVSVVIHPNRIFREGLASILAKSAFAPACAAASANDVPAQISSAGEQVLVLIGVREVSNLAEALTATKASFPDAYVVVVGDATRRDNVKTAVELGATSFVDENLATPSLVKELELLTLGEPMISRFIPKQLVHHSEAIVATISVNERQPSDTRQLVERELSGRETAILNHLVEGASNKVIAYQLQITEATVKVHVKSILRKIQVKNRTQAAIWALNGQASRET